MSNETELSKHRSAWLELDLLRRMGITNVFLRTTEGQETSSRSPSGIEEKAAELESIASEIRACTKCPLHEGRRQAVPGGENAAARIVFIGEGPGQQEDIQGIPFVGPAGKLLDKIIEAMGYTRQDVYITNIVKCRPPGNRTPRNSEMATCRPYLVRQLEVIRPSVIVTLGRPSANALLDCDDAMGKLRGKWADYMDIPVLPTYHPAYLLRSPGQKAKVWEDLKKVVRFLKEQEP